MNNAYFAAANLVTTLASNIEPAFSEDTLRTLAKAKKAKKTLDEAWEKALLVASDTYEAGRDLANDCLEATDCNTAVAYGAEATRLLKEARDLYTFGLSNCEFASQWAAFCEAKIIKIADHLHALCNQE